MKRKLVQNFRGIQALLLGPDDQNRQTLSQALEPLGLVVTCYEPQGTDSQTKSLIESAGIVFVDTDSIDLAVLPLLTGTSHPVVALIGHESPSRLQRAFEFEPSAVLMKPVRRHGLYTAVFFATNECLRRQQLVGKLGATQNRQAARRLVFKAILQVMAELGADDDEAYRYLRKESMRQRISIEKLSAELLARGQGRQPGRKTG
jgi:two-component system, response regulator / RNA-binding antiterminator